MQQSRVTMEYSVTRFTAKLKTAVAKVIDTFTFSDT